MMHVPITTLSMVMVLVGCGGKANSSPNSQQGCAVCNLATQDYTQVYQLTEGQKADLLFIWEEEKLARDVYEYLNSLYNFRVFANISKSEQRHMDAVASLKAKYDLPSHVDGNVRGEFSIPEIKSLYQDLTRKGARSLYAAFEVGQYIEITDIDDLEIRMTRAQPDTELVFSNLREGSIRHLAAFNKQLSRY